MLHEPLYLFGTMIPVRHDTPGTWERAAGRHDRAPTLWGWRTRRRVTWVARWAGIIPVSSTVRSSQAVRPTAWRPSTWTRRGWS